MRLYGIIRTNKKKLMSQTHQITACCVTTSKEEKHKNCKNKSCDTHIPAPCIAYNSYKVQGWKQKQREIPAISSMDNDIDKY